MPRTIICTGQHRDEEDQQLGVADTDEEALAEHPDRRSARGVRDRVDRAVFAVPDRLDAQIHDVERADELDDGEQHDGLGDDEPKAKRDRGDDREDRQRVSEHAQHAGPAAERDGASDGEQHTRAGDDDDRERGEGERTQGGHGGHPPRIVRARRPRKGQVADGAATA
jgi:hypothetical protein